MEVLKFISLGRKNANPQDDIQLIFSFMKLQDPGSVVREGEFATAQKYTSTLDGLGVKLDKVMKGNLLSSKQREALKSAITNQYNRSLNNQKRIVDTYSKRAQNAKIDPQDVITDYEVGSQSSNSPNDPAGIR
jgi:Txe/YoeB family toxin of Txe-Axe toxin-antitoxin module